MEGQLTHEEGTVQVAYCHLRVVLWKHQISTVFNLPLNFTSLRVPYATMSVEVITTISPTTNEPILTRNGISAQELEQLPDIATAAFQAWRITPLADRQIIIKKALKVLAEKQDDLALELTVQMGRPIAYTGKEVATAIKRAEYLLKISDDVLKDTDGEAEKGFKRFIRKVPVGPVLIIFAWNVSITDTVRRSSGRPVLTASSTPTSFLSTA